MSLYCTVPLLSLVRSSGTNDSSDVLSFTIEPGKGSSTLCNPALAGSPSPNGSRAPEPLPTNTNSFSRSRKLNFG